MLFLDIEATGTDPHRDRILELAFLEAEPDGDGGFRRQGIRVRRYDPGVPSPEDAIEVHGIRTEDAAGAPAVAEDAARVQAIVEGEVLCAYNGRRFDTLILDAELRWAGQPGLDLGEAVEIDPYRVWRAGEPLTLGSGPDGPATAHTPPRRTPTSYRTPGGHAQRAWPDAPGGGRPFPARPRGRPGGEAPPPGGRDGRLCLRFPPEGPGGGAPGLP